MTETKTPRLRALFAVTSFTFALSGCVASTEELAEFETSELETVDETAQGLAVPNVTFQTTLQNRFVGAQNNGGSTVNATATVAQAWEKFTLDDINGGSLQSGDLVFVQAGNGQYFQATNGGGSTLNAASGNRLGWETFRIVREAGAGTVQNGDVVGLQTQTTGHWVSAANGGGGQVFAYGGALGSWERFRIGGLSGSSTPTGGFAGVVSRAQFEAMFPRRNSFYTYDGLLQATATFPAFANEGSLEIRRREAAAFLANVAHETGQLVYIEEINKGDYTSWNSWSCQPAAGQRYFGRGPIQISWNYNYCAASQAIFGNQEVLRTDPGRVARDARVAWATALWFWMTQTGAGYYTSHSSMTQSRGFGETIRTINGSLECNGGNPGAVQTRIGYYLDFVGRLGATPGSNLGC